MTDSDLARIAEGLCGGPVDAIERARAGGNNRLYRVRSGGADLALKLYPRLPGDNRDRLGTEFAALAFLSCRDDVPRALARDDQAGAALYSWVGGEPVDVPSDTDIDALAQFALALKAMAERAEAGALPPASEACFAGSEIGRQVWRRLERLRAVAHDHEGVADLLDRATERLARADADARAALAGFDDDVAMGERTLSPSDFGFHNALRAPSGRLVFLDFEYFGWDDPAKLVCDVMLHPGMALTEAQGRRFAAAAAGLFADPAAGAARVAALLPLYALRWTMIILNEFLPERWARRQFAGAEDCRAARSRQLAKAEVLLRRFP